MDIESNIEACKHFLVDTKIKVHYEPEKETFKSRSKSDSEYFIPPSNWSIIEDYRMSYTIRNKAKSGGYYGVDIILLKWLNFFSQ